MTPQSAILPEALPHSLFITLSVAEHSAQTVAHIARLAHYLDAVKQLGKVNGALSFGERFWRQVAPQPDLIPSGIRTFTAINGHRSAPATAADLFLHLNSARADLNYEVARHWLEPLQSQLHIVDEQACTRYLDERDLTGFIDGTENPEGDAERSEVTLLNDPTNELLSGSSFVFVQRFEHQLSNWEKLSVKEQENVIGRTKKDSVELDDDIKPPTAHISRVVILEDGEELEIVRHSMPYFSVGGKKGLVFVAYTKDLNIIEKMLARVFGTSDDKMHDHLMDYTVAVTGAMLFTPSKEILSLLANTRS